MIVREIDRHAASEIQFVATRMRATLMEVLGRARGEWMYTMDWLVERGEEWMRANEMHDAATWTSTTNSPLHELFQGLGYAIVEESDEMVRLSRRLS